MPISIAGGELGRAQELVVHFVLSSGRSLTCSAAPGESLMDCALDNHVPGILAQCGGGCTCCTCHLYVDQPWLSQLSAMHPDEAELLPYALNRRSDSRLACQVVLDDGLSGIVVRVPEEQA